MSTIRYISLFSGIEAATVAWRPLGWEPIAYAEIEPFPKAVLKHHYPNVPDLGDMTKVDWKQYHHAADVVVGGSPCQAFSIAGLRKALDDPRGQLMLEYLRACAEIDPEWIVWENVPGVLSAEHGRAFQSLLEAVAELWPDGGAAWRVLDAQFFGVAQRRERVFLVVNTRDWRRAAPVLFERESLCWDHQSSREKRKSLAGGTAGVAENADANDGCSTPVIKAFKWNQGVKSRSLAIGEVSPTLSTEHNPAIYCYGGTQANSAREVDMSSTLTAHAAKDTPIVFPTNDERMTVRRLTPLECERLQGFPDGWTDIPWKGKKHSPDSPRYKALGNSMAVPVMRWIGEGIQLVEDNKELFKKETTS